MAENRWSLPRGLSSAEEKAIKAVFSSLQGMGRDLPPEALNALQFGNIDQFLDSVKWQELGDFGELQGILSDMASKAGVQELTLNSSLNANLSFNLVDPRAVTLAETAVGSLVREINAEVLNTIRQTVAQATAGEMTVNQLASRIRTNIPLTARDATAVDNFRERNFQSYLSEGMSNAKAREKAEAKAQRYAEKKTRQRAKTIARTETANAAMGGRFLGWEAGITEGLIASDSKKEWIAEGDACPICAPLNGEIVLWNDEFSDGSDMPPAHPNCRCSAVIMPPDTELQEGGQAEAEESQSYPDAEFDDIEGISPASQAEEDAIERYQGYEYSRINNFIETGEFPEGLTGAVLQDELRGTANNLINAVSRSTIDSPITVFRGQSLSGIPIIDRSINLENIRENLNGWSNVKNNPSSLIGQSWTTNRMMSTSALTRGGESVAVDTFRRERVHMNISVPAGSKGGALRGFTFGEAEAEVLFPPGATLTVIGARVENNYTLILDLVLTGQS
jgi:SPP1 gp7 family putative phage head morphogenesis protein